MNKVKGIIYAVSSAVAFGTIPVFAVIAYGGGTNTITTAFLRFFIASIILFSILRYKRIPMQVNRRLFGRLSYLSIVGYAATCLTLFMSYNYIPVSLASTLHFTYPAIVTVLSILIFKEKIEPMKVFSLALSIIGVYILADSGEAAISLKGVIFALASGIFYSIYTIELARAEIKVMEGLLLTFYVSLLSSASILIFGVVTGNLIFIMQPTAIFGILGLALVCTVFAILAYYKAVQIVGPSDTAILSTFEPVTGVALGMIVFGERLSLSASIGSFLIIVSVLFFSYNRNIKAREEEISKVSEN
jgi:drug/metabolite transporter (DMT)-like permease